MKHTTFKIRALASNSKDHQGEDRNETKSNEYSKDAKIEELFLGVKKIIQDSINKESKLGEFEARDRQIFVQSSKFSEGKLNSDQIEAWMGRVCREVMSTAYHYYLSEQMDYDQTKIYCCQAILKNVSQFVANNKDEITPKFYNLVDSILKFKILPYLQLKYPPSKFSSVNKKLNTIFKEINNMEVISNDFFYNSDITFQYRENGVYNDLIMQVINQIIKIADTNISVDKEDSKTNFEDFEEFMSELFEKVYDQEWMIKGKNKNIPKISQPNDRTTEKEEQERQRYKEQVKDYTHYLIGRKIPQNVQEFDQFQIKSGFINIKSPTILRIITKWCEQLWQKFENQNYYIDRTEGLTMQKEKQVNIVYPGLKKNLKIYMARQKNNILQYMKDIQLNNYNQQFSIMENQQIMNQASFLDFHERICGKFSLKVVNNLQNYIIVYLNRLIHGLMTVSNVVFQMRVGMPSWRYPPNLLSFKVGDLLRCKCTSKQRQVLRIFEQMQQISENNPQKLKIIRIKNRLKLGTNDILINVRFNNCLTAQIQLKVQSKHSQSQSSLYSYNFSHLIYEIERSYFGPISQMCSIWANLDPRIKIFRKLIAEQKSNNQQSSQKELQCFKKSKDHILVVANNSPFICFECGKAFSNNNYVIPHYKCTKCKYWKCALCTIKQKQESGLIDLIIQDEQLRANCMALRCKILPKYSVGTLIGSKLKEISYFKVIEAFHKKYLFKIISNQIQLFKQLSTVSSVQQFLNEYIIFQLSTKIIDKLPPIVNNPIKEHILPAYVKKCYKFEKQTLSLNCLDQFQTKHQDLVKILSGIKQQKRSIKFIEMSSNSIDKIDFLSYDFKNLEFLNINLNRMRNLNHLAGFQKLQTLFAINNQIYQFPVQMCSLKLKYISLSDNKITQLPAEFSYLKSLQSLRINNNALIALPQHFGDLENLKELYANTNKITNIENFTCPKLQYIDLGKNLLTTLPKQIEVLKNLNFFCIANNKVKIIQTQFAKLKKLKKFDISCNQLTIIPTNLYRAPQISYLNISFEDYSILDLSGEFFPSLQDVYLYACKIVQIKGIECLKNVEILNLSNNDLTTLPEDIYKLTNLKSLRIKYNSLNQLPSRFGELYKLRELQLQSNKLTHFPPSFFCLKLQILDFSKNKFRILPTELMPMRSLKTLSFEKNQIEMLPSSIGLLQNLQLLNLNQNKIQQLPSEMNNLKKIKKIMFQGLPMATFPLFLLNFNVSFSSCKIQSLPQNIPLLQNMDTLNFSNNQIKVIPNSIAQILNLKYLILDQNKLTQICDGIFDLPLLSTLSMSYNEIQIIPNKFDKLTYLKQLSLNYNQIQLIPDSLETRMNDGLIFEFQNNPITFIPEWVIKHSKIFSKNTLLLAEFKLKKLPNKLPNPKKYTQININDNQLEAFPSALNSCQNLMKLKLSNNLIEDLSDATFNFPHLQELDLDSNKIQIIPECYNLLKVLTNFSIKKNPLKQLPPSFKQIHLHRLSIDLVCFEDLSKTKSLQWIHTNQLQYSQTNILALPSCFGEIGYLKQFSTRTLLLKTLPESFSNLKSLTKLQIQCESFESLPENIGNLQKLQYICITKCLLFKLPDSFCKLLNLKQIYIFETNLQQLPKNIGNLLYLEDLYVRQNNLNKLPNSIFQLKNLKSLNFRDNKITSLPVGISKCQNLKEIWAQNNQIKMIPKELQQLKSVQAGRLYLEGNPVQEIQCIQYVMEKGVYLTKELANNMRNKKQLNSQP